MAELPADYMLVTPNVDSHQVIERLAVEDGHLHSRPEPERRYVAQPLRLALVHSLDLHRLANGNLR